MALRLIPRYLWNLASHPHLILMKRSLSTALHPAWGQSWAGEHLPSANSDSAPSARHKNSKQCCYLAIIWPQMCGLGGGIDQRVYIEPLGLIIAG